MLSAVDTDFVPDNVTCSGCVARALLSRQIRQDNIRTQELGDNKKEKFWATSDVEPRLAELCNKDVIEFGISTNTSDCLGERGKRKKSDLLRGYNYLLR